MLGTALLVVPGLFSTANAYQPLITDDTGTQGAGGSQLEFAGNRDRVRENGETTRIRTLPVVFTHGVSDSLDLFVQANHTQIRSTLPGVGGSGAGSPSLGFKWRFFENESSKTSLGIKPEVILPVDENREAKGLGVGRTSYGATLIVTQEMPFGALHANLFTGRDRFRDLAATPDSRTTRASLAPAWDVSEQVKLAFDVGTTITREADLKTRADFVEAGVIYSPNRDLDFALGVIRATDNAAPQVQVTSVSAGVTWRFR